MTVFKSEYRIANGENYEDIHYFKTSADMVVLEDGRNIEDVLVDGLGYTGQDLAIFKKEGKYLVTNSVGLPEGLAGGETYLLKVNTVGGNVWQRLFDHKGKNVYTRVVTSTGVSEWTNGGSGLDKSVSELKSSMELVNNTVKTHSEKINEHNTKIENIISELGEEVTAHNHDERYVKMTGGVYTGTVSVEQGQGWGVQSTSGVTNVALRMDSSNNTIVGSENYNTIIESNGNPKVKTASGTFDILHKGLGSIDADTLNGKRASEFMTTSSQNEFTAQQTITNFGLSLKNSSTGLTFKDSNNVVVGKFMTDGNGDMVFQTQYAEHLRLRNSDKAVMTRNKLIIQGDGEFRFAMKFSSTDEGVGFVSSNASGVKFTDWGNGKTIYNVNRYNNEVEFTNSIRVNGRRLSIGVIPSNPSVGDVYIG